MMRLRLKIKARIRAKVLMHTVRCSCGVLSVSLCCALRLHRGRAGAISSRLGKQLGLVREHVPKANGYCAQGSKCNDDIACVFLRVLSNCTRMPRHLAGDFHGQFETERPSANPHLMRVMLTNNYDVPQRFANGTSTRSCGKYIHVSV